MKVVGNINNLPENAKPTPLKPGEVVMYQINAGIKNPDNEQRARIPVLYPESFTIPSKDRIKVKNEEGKDLYVDIAVVENFQSIPGTNLFDIRPRKIAVPKWNHGLVMLTGGNIVDEEVYEFFELTDFNESKEKRDTSKPVYFRRIDDEKDAKERIKKRSIKREAEKAVEHMTYGEMKDFASSMNWDENMPKGILQDKVEELASTNPELFIEKHMAKDKDAKAVIKRAIDAGRISYDSQQHRIALGTQTLIKLDRAEGVDWLTQAAEYCLHNKNGEKVLANIKKLLKDEPSGNA